MREGSIGGGAILTSTDGTSWIPQTLVLPSGVSPYLQTVVYGPRGFVAGGHHQGNIFTSLDGVTPWVSRTLEASRLFRGVAHNGNVYCAVGHFGSVASSPDGINWSNQTVFDHTIYRGWGDVVFANGIFTAVGISDAIMTSPDCVSWTAVHPETPLIAGDATSMLRSVTYGDGLYVAVGDDYSSPETAPRVLSSADGVTWTVQSVPAPEGSWWHFESVTFGNGMFVAFADTLDPPDLAVHYYTSQDGASWTLHSAPFFEREWENASEVTFGNSRFVIVSDRIRSSENGLDWAMRLDFPPDSGTWLFSDYFFGAAYGNGRFVAVGQPGAAYVSADGSTWTANTPVTNHRLYTVTSSSNSNRFVALGESAIIFADFPPTISIDNVSVLEGDAGTINASFTVTLSAASSETVSVSYQTADGDAVAGVDFQTSSGVLAFTPGTKSQTIDVPVVGDTLGEQNESFFVNLSDAENASIIWGRGQGVIENDDDVNIFADGFESGDSSAWSTTVG